MVDPMDSLAFSVYSNKGVFALLLGSGISRSASIPTGWEIILDLIRKLAAVKGEDCGERPEIWYSRTFGKEPDYSELLGMVALTSAERQGVLRAYFEPTEEEREQKKKLPTAAHKAIAQLIQGGFIRVVLTTNFDRLLESALEEIGIKPSVISSSDAFNGAVPLVHSPCTIIKLHGDYLDPRLKNTVKELATYDITMDALLDRVFDEYGLIVCGWSADWDIALKAAIHRCPNRRYTMYWSSFSILADSAKMVCELRSAQVVAGMSADQFFTELESKISALQDVDSSHPVSAEIAVQTMKRYLTDPKLRIKLNDFILTEIDNARSSLSRVEKLPQFYPPVRHVSSAMQLPAVLMMIAGYWGTKAQRKLWLECFSRMIMHPTGRPQVFDDAYTLLPAFLMLHAFGVGALASNRVGNLAYVLANWKMETYRERKHVVTYMAEKMRDDWLSDSIHQDDNSIPRNEHSTSRFASNYLQKLLAGYTASGATFESCFQRVEYVIGLMAADDFERSYGGHVRPYRGTFEFATLFERSVNEHSDFYKVKSSLLRFGLFGGSPERLDKIKTLFDSIWQ